MTAKRTLTLHPYQAEMLDRLKDRPAAPAKPKPKPKPPFTQERGMP